MGAWGSGAASPLALAGARVVLSGRVLILGDGRREKGVCCIWRIAACGALFFCFPLPVWQAGSEYESPLGYEDLCRCFWMDNWPSIATEGCNSKRSFRWRPILGAQTCHRTSETTKSGYEHLTQLLEWYICKRPPCAWFEVKKCAGNRYRGQPSTEYQVIVPLDSQERLRDQD